MSCGLPAGWESAPLNSLCERLRGVSYERDEASSVAKPGHVPILRANNIDGDALRFDDLVWIPKSRVNEKQKIRKGDVVIAMSSGSKNVVGKTAQALENWEGAFGAFCGVLRLSPELDDRFLGLFLRTREYRSKISDLAAGTNINNLKSEHFAEIEVPVAPLSEQRRIVVKLEKLLGKVDTCQQRLAKIPSLLKRFRQSVLAAACSGRLTADWREENPGHLSPVAKFQNNEPEVNFLAECLPEGWQVQRVDHAATIIDSLHRTPKYADSGYPMVRVTDVKGGYLDLSSARLVSEEVFREFTRRYTPRRGDIVFSRVGSFGNVSYVGSDMKFCLGQNTAIISPNINFNSRFLHLSLQSPTVRDQMDAAVVGTSQPTISLKSISSLGVAVPPLAEQQEIARRVDELFSLADQIEARYSKAAAHVEKLTPSILAEAFRGELVPQDPNDEPAAALLQRIKRAKDGDHCLKRRKKPAVVETPTAIAKRTC